MVQCVVAAGQRKRPGGSFATMRKPVQGLAEVAGRPAVMRSAAVVLALAAALGCGPKLNNPLDPDSSPGGWLSAAVTSGGSPGSGNSSAVASVWDAINRPRITTWGAASFTAAWTGLAPAASYNIYHWTAGWVFEENTTATSRVISTNIADNRKVCAVDGDSVEFQCTVLLRWGATLPNLPGREVAGLFFDDFNDGVVGPQFEMFNPGQLTEAGGYLQLNQNITDNGPGAYVLYNRGADRYMRVQWKQYSHRANTYFSGGVTLNEATGISDRYTLTMAYKDDWPCYGLCNQRWTCEDATAFASCSGYSGANVVATQIFDAWMDLEMVLDFTAGTVTSKLNGTPYPAFLLRPDWGSKVGISISPYGWFTGHFVRIDDLSIQSQDAPFP